MLLVLTLACSQSGSIKSDDSGDTGGGSAENDSLPGEGDVVITEVMPDPAAVDGTFGEWVELQNVSANDVDLEGVALTDGDGSGVVFDAFPIAAGEIVILAPAEDPTVNGGLNVDYVYDPEVLKLDNTEDALKLAHGTTLVDQIGYLPGWPFAEGVAMQLNVKYTDASSNDSKDGWCKATKTYGAGDYGSPGEANGGC